MIGRNVPSDDDFSYFLHGETAGGVAISFNLARGANSIGTCDANDIILQDRVISERHALILCHTEGIVVKDLGSLHGTFVNQIRIQTAPVRLGDQVRFGQITFELRELAQTNGHTDCGKNVAQSVLENGCNFPGLAFPPGYVIGRSYLIQSLYREMQPLVRCDLPVLITGETGVGKEYIARILHDSSERRNGPFIALNCAAIPSELLEAEMFGIAKGVATGVSERLGKFEMANGGSLFLDEIGEMSGNAQAKLLRVLQEKEIHPLGRKPVPIDARIIAATNADLDRSINEGRFRRDLFYRVAGFVLNVPPVRGRKEDIPLLVENMLHIYSLALSKLIGGITVKAMELLMSYPWPGNIREMEHEMRRLVLVCKEGHPIDVELLTQRIRDLAWIRPNTSERLDTCSLNLKEHMIRIERELVQAAFTRARGNQSEAARLLGISRNGLAMKMRRLGIED